MNLSRVGYERVRDQLVDIATEYFTYLLADSTLEGRDREQLVKRDAAIFAGLARIYGDEKTPAYLDNLLEEASISPIAKPTTNGKEVKPGVRRQKPLTLEVRSQITTPTSSQDDLEGFTPLSVVYKELKIDEEMLRYVSERVKLEIEKRKVKGADVKGVSHETYSAIRKEVRKLRG
ncbi:MAG: hypothetical protein AABX10_03035 [Nanoarchaeota archaeon]